MACVIEKKKKVHSCSVLTEWVSGVFELKMNFDDSSAVGNG